MKRTTILCLLILPFTIQSQTGGSKVYSFLNLPFSARTAALGGNNISIKDDDINMIQQNPALLDTSMNNKLGLSYINYFTDINYGYATYAKNIPRYGMFGAGMQFFNYGKFTRADETGLITGSFKAADDSFNIIYSKAIDSTVHFGATLKTIYSTLENYTSFGSAVDLGITYNNAKLFFTAAAVIKNAGVQWKAYTRSNREPLPFEIQIGITKKLPKAPLRFSLTGQHLEKWDLTYEDPANPTPTVDPLTGESIKQNKGKIFGNKLARHFIFGTEFLISKNFHLRIGYNYQRRQEMKVETRPGMVGFSFGAGFKISKFQLSYGRAAYHLAGASNHFTITTNLSDFYSRK